MSIFTAVWQWLGKAFHSIKTDGAKIAVAITEDVQTALKSGAVGALADVVSSVFPNVKNLPQEIVTDLQNIIPKALASELALQGLPDTPTQQDLLDFENKVLTAFNLHDDKSKLYSVLSAQIYGVLIKHTGQGPVTFAQRLADVEEMYQDFVKDKAEIAAGNDTV